MTFEQMEALATEEALARFVMGQHEELVSAVREVAAIEAIYKEQGLSVPKEAMEAEYAAAVAQFRQQVHADEAHEMLLFKQSSAHGMHAPYVHVNTVTITGSGI